MRYQLSDSVRLLPGVGPKVAENLTLMGIENINQLLYWFPRQYLDASNPTAVANTVIGKRVAVSVEVLKIEEGRTHNRGMRVLTATCQDAFGDSITVQWFNQPFLKQKVIPGSHWIMIGAVQWFGKKKTLANPVLETRAVVLPIYPQTAKVTSRFLRGLIGAVLATAEIPEDMPINVLQEHHLVTLPEIMRRIHQPVSMDDVYGAKQGFAFREAWFFFLSMEQAKGERSGENGPAIPLSIENLKNLIRQLPFELTAGQKRVTWDCLQEMASGSLMTRLINGDVGAGKTVVAGLLAAMAAEAGYMTMFLAPTEILAQQHYLTLRRFLGTMGVRIGIWTGSTKDDQAGNAQILVGTHALLYDKIDRPNLGLIVVDEQHRFGVEQRAALRRGRQIVPHMVSMTATPIPRTLALTLFADLDVSFLRGKPQGRLPVQTLLVGTVADRGAMHRRILQEIVQGHQVFVVCPAIVPKDSDELVLFDDDAAGGKKAVEQEVARLRAEHPEYGSVEALHGKMKPREKQAVMERMQAGQVNVLVATSVIEVGVDVPNATVLVIEGAESFGLAQLHQLRGRVGRSEAAAYCFLCPTGSGTQERLQVLVDTDDGFAVAEADLAQRGPGDLRGLAQSGLPDFHFASLTDVDYLRDVRAALRSYLLIEPDYIQHTPEQAYSRRETGLE